METKKSHERAFENKSFFGKNPIDIALFACYTIFKFDSKGVDEERSGKTNLQRAGGRCESGTLQFPFLSLLSRKEESVPLAGAR